MKGKVDPLHLSELITFLRHSHSLFVCHGQPFTRHPRPSVVTPSVVRREPARSTLRLSGSVTLHPRSSGSVSLSGLFTSTSGSGASPEGGDPRRIEDKIDSVPFLLSLHYSCPRSVPLPIRGAAGSEATVGSERYAITTGHITYGRRPRHGIGDGRARSCRLYSPPCFPPPTVTVRRAKPVGRRAKRDGRHETRETR